MLSHKEILDAYILYGYSNSQNFEKIKNSWKFRGIKPILYLDHDDHAVLHKTLREMPEKTNAQGRKYYILQYAKSDPDKLSDDFRNQVIWSINSQDNDVINTIMLRHLK